jgi:Polyketide cyclase / dehydrase and lipid transport
MQGKKQLERSAMVAAPVSLVYELFMDNAELANWAPVVDAVTAEEGGDASGIGCTRTCAVTMQGKSGVMVERCVEVVEGQRASFVVVHDSFGLNKMLRDYGFTAHFASSREGPTEVTIETFYTPANPLAAVINALVLRRKLSTVVGELLAGLSTLAQERANRSA